MILPAFVSNFKRSRRGGGGRFGGCCCDWSCCCCCGGGGSGCCGAGGGVGRGWVRLGAGGFVFVQLLQPTFCLLLESLPPGECGAGGWCGGGGGRFRFFRGWGCGGGLRRRFGGGEGRGWGFSCGDLVPPSPRKKGWSWEILVVGSLWMIARDEIYLLMLRTVKMNLNNSLYRI